MKLLIFCFATVVLTCPVKGQNIYDTTQLKAHIQHLDRAHAVAIFKGDTAALDSLMDDEINVNHPTNKIVNEKKELFNLILQGIIRYTAFERIQEKFLFFKNMVVVMGYETVVPAGNAPNAGKIVQRRYTNMWIQKNNKWKLCVRHAHNVCQSN